MVLGSTDDYADALIRAFRYTGLFSVRGARIVVASGREAELDELIFDEPPEEGQARPARLTHSSGTRRSWSWGRPPAAPRCPSPAVPPVRGRGGLLRLLRGRQTTGPALGDPPRLAIARSWTPPWPSCGCARRACAPGRTVLSGPALEARCRRTTSPWWRWWKGSPDAGAPGALHRRARRATPRRLTEALASTVRCWREVIDPHLPGMEHLAGLPGPGPGPGGAAPPLPGRRLAAPQYCPGEPP